MGKNYYKENIGNINFVRGMYDELYHRFRPKYNSVQEFSSLESLTREQDEMVGNAISAGESTLRALKATINQISQYVSGLSIFAAEKRREAGEWLTIFALESFDINDMMASLRDINQKHTEVAAE